MAFSSIYGHPVSILHFPGQQKFSLDTALKQFKETPVRLPDNITIVSVISSDTIDASPLHYQLTKNNIPYINPLAGKVCDKQWFNRHKLNYINEALKEVKTEYCLILDGSDVVIVDDLSNLIYKFKGYEKDILYCATRNRYPNVEIETIDGLDDIRERPIIFGVFCYINAGCCIGKTKALKKLYSKAFRLSKGQNVPSEQYYLRKVIKDHQDKIFFDFDCRIFQVFNKDMWIEDPDNPSS